jgi:hypothetical protein
MPEPSLSEPKLAELDKIVELFEKQGHSQDGVTLRNRKFMS